MSSFANFKPSSRGYDAGAEIRRLNLRCLARHIGETRRSGEPMVRDLNPDWRKLKIGDTVRSLAHEGMSGKIVWVHPRPMLKLN